MVGGGVAVRHQNGWPAEHQQLGHRGGARAGDHQVARREALWQIIEEGRELGLEAQGGIGRLHLRQILGATLLGEAKAAA